MNEHFIAVAQAHHISKKDIALIIFMPLTRALLVVQQNLDYGE